MPQIPPSLLELQQKFGNAISTPLELLDDDANFCMRQDLYDLSLIQMLVPREDLGLSGADRLATYNQQYWFRLLSTMQEEYPLLARLTGPRLFAQLVMDYLQQFPSSTATLRDLSRWLVTFLSMHTSYNRPQWLQAAELEYLYIHAFDAAQLPVLNLNQLTSAQQQEQITKPLIFQPHFQLFAEQLNLVELRMSAKQENDPQAALLIPLAGNHHWAVFRIDNQVHAEPLGPLQYQLLANLKRGLCVDDAVGTVMENCNEHAQQFVEERLAMWFAHWRAMGWFVQPLS